MMPQVSASSREPKNHPSVCLSSPLSLSSPVIKKKAIQISSFDEKGVTYEKYDTKQPATDRSFVPICSSISASAATSSQASWSKTCQYLQRNYTERASTLPRAKPKTYSSTTLSAKPIISIFPAPKPNSSPTLKPEPSNSFHLSASQLSNHSPLVPKPSYRNYTQTANVGSSHPSYQQMHSERSAAPATTSKTSDSTAASSNIEGRRRRFDLSNETRADSAFTYLRGNQKEDTTRTITGKSCKLSQQTGASQMIKSPQKNRFWSKARSQTTQMDVQSRLSQSACVSRDYSCQSGDIDQEIEASQCAHRLNRFKTCLVAPQTQEGSQPASVERTTSQTGTALKHQLDYKQSPVHNKNHKEVSDTGRNQTDILAAPDCHWAPTKLLEYPSEECSVSWSVALCPLNTNSFGTSSTGVFDLPSHPQHSVYQRPDKTATASLPEKQLNYSQTDRAFIMEEQEDPYYVTMYYPGSVYVDMSDVVPPEVRPKPAVPAKPPNVGVPSPSSPFPPQGLGIGGVGASAPPPSSIPVPIGSHGPNHGGSHLGHSMGHSAGHVGGHAAAAHTGGHAHGGSHNSSGGSTLLGYIGIDTIIEQMRKKTMKTGFDFNIMVVGNSGLGKSTLVNTLFKSQVSRRSAGWSRDDKIPKTVEIKAVSHVIEEGGVKMKLTVVDTPGFGDQINNDNCWEPISKYINEQYEKFLKEEVNITRKKRIPDTRVHCCLYFISPTGHSLRQLDVEFMKRLSHSVNIIPIIAKADTMTIEERQEFKQRVRKELEMSGIEFYPQKEFDDDMEDKSDNDKIREAMPFAVVGSDKEYQVNGKRVLGRKTAWGVVEVENPNHCEFAQLRDFLIRSHLQDLKEVTHNIHYETYRAKRLNENGGLHPISSNDTQESNL
ncbi:hypothetical protein PAMP_020966 [Pampus punctatissimus]